MKPEGSSLMLMRRKRIGLAKICWIFFIATIWLGCESDHCATFSAADCREEPTVSDIVVTLDSSEFYSPFLRMCDAAYFDSSSKVLRFSNRNSNTLSTLKMTSTVSDSKLLAIELEDDGLYRKLVIDMDLSLRDFRVALDEDGAVVFVQHYANDSLYIAGAFEMGMPIGNFYSFYPNGNIMFLGVYGDSCFSPPCLLLGIQYDLGGSANDTIWRIPSTSKREDFLNQLIHGNLDSFELRHPAVVRFRKSIR